MATIWFTSDTHFGHKNIIKFCTRPFSSIEDMDRALINNWNSLVSKEDTVYHLGDFTMTHSADRWRTYLEQLNGEIHLVLGNHDQEKVARKMVDEGLLKEAVHYKRISTPAGNLILSHYAMRVWHGSHHGVLHLYGHSHGTLIPLARSMDVGVDANYYRPISLDSVVKLLKPQEHEATDYHGKS